jgi:hypothetical protein
MAAGYTECPRRCGGSIKKGKKRCLKCGAFKDPPKHPAPPPRGRVTDQHRPYSRKPGLGSRGWHV